MIKYDVQKKRGSGGVRGRGVGQRPTSLIICELF